jgi:hypothetical protein
MANNYPDDAAGRDVRETIYVEAEWDPWGSIDGTRYGTPLPSLRSASLPSSPGPWFDLVEWGR